MLIEIGVFVGVSALATPFIFYNFKKKYKESNLATSKRVLDLHVSNLKKLVLITRWTLKNRQQTLKILWFVICSIPFILGQMWYIIQIDRQTKDR